MIRTDRSAVALVAGGALACAVAAAADVGPLVADRLAIEKVYYERRFGDKRPFESTSPRSKIEKAVRLDAKKEHVLRTVYGKTVSAEELDDEMRRINTTTRAPDTLAEIKRALGGDPNRITRSLAKPIVVERELRGRFKDDRNLHAAARARAQSVRESLLRGRRDGLSADEMGGRIREDERVEVTTLRWRLGQPPSGQADTPLHVGGTTEGQSSAGPYTLVVTVGLARASAPVSAVTETVPFFHELPAELQRVLAAQLRERGDVSAVIETPEGFLVYLATRRTPDELAVTCFHSPKLSYEDWLAAQPDE